MSSSGVLDAVEPQATDRLAWQALAATEGGTLPVREYRDDRDSPSLRLLEPLFQVRIQPTVQTSNQLPAGIRITAALGYHTDTVASRANIWIAKWWQDANAQSRME